MKAVTFEQAKVQVSQKPAKPLFFEKLKILSRHLDLQLISDNLSVGERFILLRDQAFFNVQFFSGDRANDLGLCLTQEIKRFPDGSGVLFYHTFHYTRTKVKIGLYCFDTEKTC